MCLKSHLLGNINPVPIQFCSFSYRVTGFQIAVLIEESMERVTITCPPSCSIATNMSCQKFKGGKKTEEIEEKTSSSSPLPQSEQ